MEEEKYIKGFNGGYFLKEHEPEIFDILLKGFSNDSVYKDGFLAGGVLIEKERLFKDVTISKHQNYKTSISKTTYKTTKQREIVKENPEIDKN